MTRVFTISLALWLSSCSYSLYDKEDYATLNFTTSEKFQTQDQLNEVYLMSTYRSSKVLHRVIDGDTIYDDISIPVYTTKASKDLIQSVYLIFSQSTEKVCYKVLTAEEDIPGHHLRFQDEHSGCDLFGKFRVIDESTIGLNLMNDDSRAFYVSCDYQSEGDQISHITFKQIDYQRFSQTKGASVTPIAFDQVFYTQMTFERTSHTYVYRSNTGEEIPRESLEESSIDKLAVKTKKGKIRKVLPKGYPFYLK